MSLTSRYSVTVKEEVMHGQTKSDSNSCLVHNYVSDELLCQKSVLVLCVCVCVCVCVHVCTIGRAVRAFILPLKRRSYLGREGSYIHSHI